jgi:hypothetical protein
LSSPHLDLARGGVREGLTAIHNLAQLLRSRRVAARALAVAVSEVREASGHVLLALSDLERAALEPLVAEPAFATAIAGLFSDTRARASELAGVLARAAAKPFDARRRLALEQALRPIAEVIETALVVVDLLEALREPRPTSLDLAELVRERWSAPRRPESVPARIEPRLAIPWVADARIVGALIELTAALIATRPTDELVLSGEAATRTTAILQLSVARPPRREARAARAHGELAAPRFQAKDEFVRALAERAGLALSIAADRRSAALRL